MAEPEESEDLSFLLSDNADTEEDDAGEETESEETDLDALRQELESYKADATAARNFRANPVQGLNELAAQLGYQVAPQNPSAAPESQPTSGGYESAVREAVEEAFAGSDVGFLKPEIQNAISKAMEKIIKPIEEMTQREKETQRRTIIQSVETQMDQDFPNWRAHNDEMQEVGNFLRSALNGGNVNHPKYGNLYKMAYQIVTGEGKATATAARRLSGAARNSTRTGGTGTARPDVGKKIKSAENRDSQIEIALDAAIAELGL